VFCFVFCVCLFVMCLVSFAPDLLFSLLKVVSSVVYCLHSDVSVKCAGMG
jgi:hypothetical protein